MRLSLLTFVFFASMFLVFPQQPEAYFDYAISQHLKSYKEKSEIATKDGDIAYAQFLFDSLVDNHLKYSQIADMTLKKVNGGTYKTAKTDNAYLLITKSPWQPIDTDEIEAINNISKMYKDQVDIIVLFWSTRREAKKLSSDYASTVTVTYVDEKQNNANHIIKPFKHSFGAPACFFISEEKQLINIDKKFTLGFNFDTTIDVALKETHEQIKLMLFEDGPTNESIITTLN